MTMQRHEVPPGFVRGRAEPSDVQYVEIELCNALRGAPPVSYSVLYIDVIPLRAVVEIEAGAGAGTIGERAEAATVRRAGDACIAAFAAQLMGPPVTALPA
jgi:hypothetical protein